MDAAAALATALPRYTVLVIGGPRRPTVRVAGLLEDTELALWQAEAAAAREEGLPVCLRTVSTDVGRFRCQAFHDAPAGEQQRAAARALALYCAGGRR